MNQNVIYIGIDVDDVRYHGSALDKHTGEVSGFSLPAGIEGFGEVNSRRSKRILRRSAQLDAVLRSLVRWIFTAARSYRSRLSL